MNDSPSAGYFIGTGLYNPNTSYTWNITGNITGSSIAFTIVYTGSNAGYTLHGVGTIATNGSISGTVDNNCQTFSMSAGAAKFVTKGMITGPDAGSAVFGLTELEAWYLDESPGVNDDIVQWAVRKGTCAAGTGTVWGNVDGKNDSYNWDGADFSATINTTGKTPGMYCFVFNPADDAGQPNVRETREFYIGELTATHLDYNFVGTEHTVTADIGVPVAGVPIVLEVVDGPDTEMTDSENTNGSGLATLSYINNGTSGEDTVTVCVDENENETCDEGEPMVTLIKHWLAPFMTGGGNVREGKIVKWTFGGNVGREDGLPVGNFQLTDHTSKTNYHFNIFKDVVVVNDHTMSFTASGRMNGNEGTIDDVHVTISDKGEPGKDVDIITISNLLGGGETNISTAISGGNFQVFVQ